MIKPSEIDKHFKIYIYFFIFFWGGGYYSCQGVWRQQQKIKVNTTEQKIFLCAISNHGVIVKLCKKYEYILCIQVITRQKQSTISFPKRLKCHLHQRNVIKHNCLIWNPVTNCLWCLSFVIAWIKTSVKWINANEMWWKCPILNLFKLFFPYFPLYFHHPLVYRSVSVCALPEIFHQSRPDITVVFLSRFLASLPFPEPWRTLLTGWFKGEHHGAGDEIISFLSSTALFPLLMGSPAAS